MLFLASTSSCFSGSLVSCEEDGGRGGCKVGGGDAAGHSHRRLSAADITLCFSISTKAARFAAARCSGDEFAAECCEQPSVGAPVDLASFAGTFGAEFGTLSNSSSGSLTSSTSVPGPPIASVDEDPAPLLFGDAEALAGTRTVLGPAGGEPLQSMAPLALGKLLMAAFGALTA